MRCFQEAISNRRTNYNLGKDIKILPSQITAAIEKLVIEVPSAFNMQSTRVVVAMGKKHSAIWHITKEILQEIVPKDRWPQTKEKINSFMNAYGTVLFFDDIQTVQDMQKQYTSYANNFPIWAQQANGMLQFTVWTALTNMGLGVNLQHYNPLIDEKVKILFSIPENWKLIAQMPFGRPLQAPAAIEKMPVSRRVKIFYPDV